MPFESPAPSLTRSSLHAPSALRGAHPAFTFIEVMAVLVILGLLAGAVAYKFVGAAATARTTRARTDIVEVGKAIDVFRMEKGRLPTNREGLSILPFQNEMTDPWERPYQYVQPGPGGADFDVISLGADGRPGGEDDAADIRLSSVRGGTG